MKEIIKDIKKNVREKEEIIILNESKERVGMSSMGIKIGDFVKG